MWPDDPLWLKVAAAAIAFAAVAAAWIGVVILLMQVYTNYMGG